MKYYFKAIKNYDKFNGRARRREFWMFILFHIIFALISMILDNLLETNVEGLPFGLFYFLYVIFTFIPTLAITVRRLHDIGKSGWLYLIILIPVLGALSLLFLTLENSQEGTNKWGSNPKENL